MAEPVNLNRFRKAKARAEKKARADENAVKFGQTGAEKKRDKALNKKTKSQVDQHKLDE